MKQIFKYFLIVITIISSTSLFAQKKWTLDECINQALQNNIQIKRNIYTSEIAKSDYIKSYADVTPTINAYGGHGISKGLSYNYYQSTYEDKKVESGSFGISSELDLFQGFTKISNINSNRYGYLASKADVEKLKNDLVLNVVANYLQVLYASEMLELATEQLVVADLKLNKAKSQFELGQITQGGFLEIKSQYYLEKKNLTVSNNNLVISRLTLAQFLELDSTNNFQIDLKKDLIISSPSIPDCNQIFGIASVSLPEIKSSEYRFLQSKKGLNMARALRSPRIYMSVDYNSRYSQNARDPFSATLRPYPDYSYSNQIADNTFTSIRLNIQIPIFNKYSAQNQISRAKINVLDRKEALNETKKQVLKDIQQAFADALAAKDTYDQSNESVNALLQVFEFSSQKFDLGMINAVEYWIAKSNLVRAKAELINAKYSYLLKLKILDFYRGIPITL